MIDPRLCGATTTKDRTGRRSRINKGKSNAQEEGVSKLRGAYYDAGGGEAEDQRFMSKGAAIYEVGRADMARGLMPREG